MSFVQIRHPVSGLWVLLSRRTGRILRQRERQWPGVPVYVRPE